MELTEIFQPGMVREESFEVGDEHTALHVGSGASRVLATPWMIAFMERTAHQLLAQHLPEGYSSVGTLVNVRHLAPTPVGETVHVRAEILAVDGHRITFSIQVRDKLELVGEGEHQRVVIEEARFLRRVAAKSGATA